MKVSQALFPLFLGLLTFLEKKSGGDNDWSNRRFVELKNSMTLGEIYDLALKEIDKLVEEEMNHHKHSEPLKTTSAGE